VLIEHGADYEADLGHAAQRPALALDCPFDAAEIPLGHGQQEELTSYRARVPPSRCLLANAFSIRSC
jgi:hypothetical protein